MRGGNTRFLGEEGKKNNSTYKMNMKRKRGNY